MVSRLKRVNISLEIKNKLNKVKGQLKEVKGERVGDRIGIGDGLKKGQVGRVNTKCYRLLKRFN